MNNTDALKELLYKIADDQLILGHRNSEWTGIGPLLEEDIAFSSMAQDKVGQSSALYKLLHDLGEKEPDTIAFMRDAAQYRCSHLVELPIGEYDFSLIRHFLFDTAELIRFDMLSRSSYKPLAQLAQKLKGEIKYHVMHADIWIKQLGTSADESVVERMQNALNYAMPYALGIFETSPYEAELIESHIFEGEKALKEQWLQRIEKVLAQTNLTMPDVLILSPAFGGRQGQHTEYLQPLLDEMTEVFRIEPDAKW
jgi:ring-1,2-phenylacetyl-CoA epoxidase subunit PaaC